MIGTGGRVGRLGISILVTAGLLAVAGCDFKPKGSTLFTIEGRREYDRATIQGATGLETRQPLKLRWIDTNTFYTTATLSPGDFAFVARTGAGYYYTQPVKVTAGKERYTLPAISVGSATPSEGPAVSGRLGAMDAGVPAPAFVTVLFISNEITLRTASVVDGKFTATGPFAGRFRVEVIALGPKPKSWFVNDVDLTRRHDLGLIVLR